MSIFQGFIDLNSVTQARETSHGRYDIYELNGDSWIFQGRVFIKRPSSNEEKLAQQLRIEVSKGEI